MAWPGGGVGVEEQPARVSAAKGTSVSNDLLSRRVFIVWGAVRAGLRFQDLFSNCQLSLR